MFLHTKVHSWRSTYITCEYKVKLTGQMEKKGEQI